MTVHVGKHFSFELISLFLLTTPVAIIVAIFIGLAGGLLGEWVVGLWTAAIAGMATLVLVPIYIRVSRGPNTQVNCADCITQELSHRLERTGIREKRKHTRYQVDVLLR